MSSLPAVAVLMGGNVRGVSVGCVRRPDVARVGGCLPDELRGVSSLPAAAVLMGGGRGISAEGVQSGRASAFLPSSSGRGRHGAPSVAAGFSCENGNYKKKFYLIINYLNSFSERHFWDTKCL